MRNYWKVEKRFDESAKEAIKAAEEESTMLAHLFIDSGFLLLGLTGQRTTASKALSKSGFHLKRGRRELQRIIGKGSGFIPSDFRITPVLVKILESSLQESEQRKDNFISSEDLLAVLLDQTIESKGGVASKMFKAMDIDPVTIKKNLLELTEQ